MVHFAAVTQYGSKFERFFLPNGPFSAEAMAINGLNMEKLIEKGAEPFNVKDANDIAEFMPGRGFDNIPVATETHAISHGYVEGQKDTPEGF